MDDDAADTVYDVARLRDMLDKAMAEVYRLEQRKDELIMRLNAIDALCNEAAIPQYDAAQASLSTGVRVRLLKERADGLANEMRKWAQTAQDNAQRDAQTLEGLRQLMTELGSLRDSLRRSLTALSPDLSAGASSGESHLYEDKRDGFYVRQLPDDPIAIRVSIGEVLDKRPSHPGETAYLVFRGDLHQIRGLLLRAVQVLSQ